MKQPELSVCKELPVCKEMSVCRVLSACKELPACIEQLDPPVSHNLLDLLVNQDLPEPATYLSFISVPGCLSLSL
jgi:hypothetical protein